MAIGFTFVFFSTVFNTTYNVAVCGVVFVLAAIYLCYINLINAKNKVSEAFSSIDVQLKKRYDLIPNILKTANKFMEHEKSLIEEITKLRTEIQKLPLGKKMELEKSIQQKMSQLMVAVENYPQLKSDNTMIVLMQTYNEVEEHICASRRFYNSAVNHLNNLVEIFPSSIIAGMLNIKKQKYFEIQELERKPIEAGRYFK